MFMSATQRSRRIMFWLNTTVYKENIKIALVLLFGVTLAACGAEIGDECSSNADCGQGRICDLSSRGGYCTVTPCADESCPEGSACVEFENEESYCMAICSGNDDCRGGYSCDGSLGSTKVCIQNEQ